MPSFTPESGRVNWIRPLFAAIERPEPRGRDKPEPRGRDNAAVSEAAATAIPRRGRPWVILALGLALAGLGAADAPVSIQVFNDLQCGNCRDEFLTTIPALVEGYVRGGEAKLLMRHYSIAANPLELGFFGAEAAAQQGYGWQYTYLFFVNQAEADRFGIGDRLMSSLAGSIGELDMVEWEAALDGRGGSGDPIAE